MDFYSSGNEAVDAMETVTITGNITAPRWYQTILRENGKPYRLAIDILADIVYWYRPVEIRDETTGHIVGIRKRFKADYLQKTYEQYANLYGESKRTVKAAFDKLVELEVIERIFREVTYANDMKLYNVMFISLNVRRLLELTYTEEQLNKSGLLVQKQEVDTPEPAEIKDSVGGPTKFCTTPYKILQEGVQKIVPPPTEDCMTLPQNNVGPPTPDCRTYTENTTETTDGDYPIHLSRITGEGIRLGRDDRSDKMDQIPTRAEQYRELIYENTHLEWHLKNDPVGEREEYENLVELICDVVCAEHNRPVFINSTAMDPTIVRSRFLKLTDSHLQYVMECLRNNPNQKGIESYRNYKLTCLYNAPVTMDTYYQQRVNHDMNTGFPDNSGDT